MRSLLAGTPFPEGKWGTDLLQSWLQSGEGCLIRSGTPRDLCAHKTREIWARIDRQLDLLEREIHAVLVGDLLVEGRA